MALVLASSGRVRSVEAVNPTQALTPPQDEHHAMPPSNNDAALVMGDWDRGSWLGVELADVTAGDAQKLKLPGAYGAIVGQVSQDSPAARAGIQTGDVILNYDGEKVRSVAELRRLVRETPPGRSVSIQVSRNGQLSNLSAQLEARKNPLGMHFIPPAVTLPRIEIPDFNIRLFGAPARLGISGDALSPQLADYFAVKEGKGVLVSEVEAGSAAAKAGLKAGDVIIKAEDTVVGSVSDLRKVLARNPDKSWTITLAIVRDRHEERVTVQLEPADSGLPTWTAELESLGIRPEELSRRLQTEIRSHGAELRQAQEEWRKQIKPLIQSELQMRREQLQQEIRRALEEREQELKRLRQEAPQPHARRADQEI